MLDRINLGYGIQAAGCTFLAAALLWSSNLVKGLILVGVLSLVVGRWVRQPRRKS